MEGDSLKLRLRPRTYDGDHGASGPGEVFGPQSGGGGRAKCRQERHFTDQQRITGSHIGQHPQCHHRKLSLGRVPWVAVYVLEGVDPVVGTGHQFDHTMGIMGGMAR